ncbi:MAG: hypothetical protein HC905_30810 [Bacteroidales bacterium]|nr:hypothetical protein [Bacteroidales bacterium]
MNEITFNQRLSEVIGSCFKVRNVSYRHRYQQGKKNDYETDTEVNFDYDE